MTTLRIANRDVGPDHLPLIVAEIGLAHRGDLSSAIQYVRDAATLGFGAVKMQYQMPEHDLDGSHPWRDTLERCALNHDEHAAVRRFVQSLGMLYGCTPFCVEAVDKVASLGPDYIKIGGAGWKHPHLVASCVATGLPLMVSRGCDLDSPHVLSELPNAIPLHVASSYPTSAEESGCGAFASYTGRLWGLSDHSATPWPGLAAVAHGACVVEAHFPREGPDKNASLRYVDAETLTSGARWIWRAMRSKEPKHNSEVAKLATHNEANGWRRTA